MATEAQQAKVAKVLGEFKAGTLKSGSGATVTSEEQAVAIALSEASLARKKSPPVVELDNPDTMDKLERWNRDEVMTERTPEERRMDEMFKTEMPERSTPAIMQQIAATPKQMPGPSINDVISNARRS